MQQTESKWKHTKTLEGLYSAQGHPQPAAETFGSPGAGSCRKAASGHADKTPGNQSGDLAKLAALAGQWIDLLRRSRYLETKS
ncbi:MAG: hypothetical protein ACOC7W_07425 [Desulfosalsimonas sp.]